MEVLELDGRKYVKAATAARDLGYTADYVGQLCRGGKIDAHLVGRSWYVAEDSIRAHRLEKQRSSQAKTREALKEDLQEQAAARPVAIRVADSAASPAYHFYSKLTPKKVKYDEDRSELIPVLTEKKDQESTPIDVRLAGAKSLEVEKVTPAYKMQATERPKIRFSGDVTVSKDDGASEKQDELTTTRSGTESRVTEPKHSTETTTKVVDSKKEQKSKNVRLSSSDADGLTQSLPLKRGAVVAMTRARSNQGDAKDAGNLQIKATVPKAVHPKHRRRRITALLSLTIAFCLGSVLALGILAADQRIVSNSAESSSESWYHMELTNIKEAVQGLK